VSTLSAALVGYRPDTIRASLGRLEAAGKARCLNWGFDHLDEDEDGWENVITDAESAATDEEIRRQIEAENNEFGPYYDDKGRYIDPADCRVCQQMPCICWEG
jgi:hypothetical protein